MAVDQYKIPVGTYRLPVSRDPGRHAWIHLPPTMTAEEWDRMINLPSAFRDGVVVDDHPEPGPAPVRPMAQYPDEHQLGAGESVED